ncbi:MAG: YdcF family protein [Patescibacteria group bacterium]|nr:YdcF family protein [Patescibacteria group bacterium]
MDEVYFANLEDKKIVKLLDLIKKQQPKKSDVIIWLQGDRYDRGEKVLELFKSGFSKKIVVSGNNQLRKGSSHIFLTEMVEWLKKKGVKSTAIIVEDSSLNTKEQAKNVLNLTKEKKWKTLILVASLYHQPRVFLTFLKRSEEMELQIELINQSVNLDFLKIPDGRRRMGQDLFLEEVEKVKKYKDDLATVNEGIFYLTKHETRN